MDIINNTEVMDKKVVKTFFNKTSLKNAKRTIIVPTVFQIYFCSKSVSLDDGSEYGVWSALIVEYPQDCSTKPQGNQMTFMISGSETSDSSVKTRLKGIEEVLKWITEKFTPTGYGNIYCTIYVSDIFIANLLRDWIPDWIKKDYRMGKGDEIQYRPNHELLRAIGSISTKINLSVEWKSEHSYEMEILTKKICDIIDKESNKEISKD